MQTRHPFEERLQIAGFRCGPRRLYLQLVTAIPDRADQSDLMSCTPQHRLDQVGRGGLAVGPGHSHHGERARGMTVEPTRNNGKALPGIRHLHHRPTPQRRLRQISSLYQDCNSARCPGGLNEVVAIPPEPSDTYKQIAGPYLSGIVPDLMNLQIDRPVEDLVLGPIN